MKRLRTALPLYRYKSRAVNLSGYVSLSSVIFALAFFSRTFCPCDHYFYVEFLEASDHEQKAVARVKHHCYINIINENQSVWGRGRGLNYTGFRLVKDGEMDS